MVQDPNQPAGGEPEAALGFDSPEASKDEKYNTRYLVANMQGEQRQSKLIMIAVVAAALLGLGVWVAISGSSESPIQHAASTPAAPSVEAVTPEAPKPTEAPKPPGEAAPAP